MPTIKPVGQMNNRELMEIVGHVNPGIKYN